MYHGSEAYNGNKSSLQQVPKSESFLDQLDYTWNDAISQLLRISVKSEEEKDHSLMTRYIRAKSEHSPRLP